MNSFHLFAKPAKPWSKVSTGKNHILFLSINSNLQANQWRNIYIEKKALKT